MKITVESTAKVVFLDGIQCRIWEGQTESGIAVHCYIPRIGVHDLDASQFEAELRECHGPAAVERRERVRDHRRDAHTPCEMERAGISPDEDCCPLARFVKAVHA